MLVLTHHNGLLERLWSELLDALLVHAALVDVPRHLEGLRLALHVLLLQQHSHLAQGQVWISSSKCTVQRFSEQSSYILDGIWCSEDLSRFSSYHLRPKEYENGEQIEEQLIIDTSKVRKLIHSVPLIWASDIRLFLLFGQNIAAPNSPPYIKIFLI